MNQNILLFRAKSGECEWRHLIGRAADSSTTESEVELGRSHSKRLGCRRRCYCIGLPTSPSAAVVVESCVGLGSRCRDRDPPLSVSLAEFLVAKPNSTADDLRGHARATLSGRSQTSPTRGAENPFNRTAQNFLRGIEWIEVSQPPKMPKPSPSEKPKVCSIRNLRRQVSLATNHCRRIVLPKESPQCDEEELLKLTLPARGWSGPSKQSATTPH